MAKFTISVCTMVFASIALVATVGHAGGIADPTPSENASNNNTQNDRAVFGQGGTVTTSSSSTLVLDGAGGGFTTGESGAGFSTESSSAPGGLPTGISAGDVYGDVSIWVQASYNAIDVSETGLEMEGDVYVGAVGADYTFSDKLKAGLAIGYESAHLDTDYNSGAYRGDGFSVMPYLMFDFSDQWTLSALLGYANLDYDTDRNQGGVSANFEAQRLFSTVAVEGSYAYGGYRFKPKASVLVLREYQEQYTDSTGAVTLSEVQGYGRLSAGGKVGYKIRNAIPYLRMEVMWDFDVPGRVTTATGATSKSDAIAGIANLGYEMSFGSFTASVEAGYNSFFRQDVDHWISTLRASYTF
ncbi:MAG: autotransporter outer membrane beta-barrel domain-containing protein [Alphaproteobacteria bacterium]|nr:autotransporter outer membrane beta-barrel domain-containing protein [Alphaproteobacteria bacterium]MBO6865117.1 autotransporter outer membrane beta-barrel domain-containing protein [Alphaproteobacteria bacterium]MEC9265828.1 autotransporter outer membrane beta-barrel domain-containing protein [Pseudomonadota bacterium]